MSHQIFKTIHQRLSKGEKLILVRIIRRSGSTPRNVGTMCLVTQDNKLIGTVGGGILEYQVHQKAKALFEDPQTHILNFKLSSEDLAKSGMICGGDADLYLEPLFPSNPETVDIFSTLCEQLDHHKGAKLITRINAGVSPEKKGQRCLLPDDGSCLGKIEEIENDTFIKSKNQAGGLIEIEETGELLFVDHIFSNPRIFLFGAGHVSACIAPLAKTVGFDITVIDDRPEFANRSNFECADQILVSDFETVFHRISIPDNGYILIITRGHLHDKKVLEKALETPAAYIGMIGSIRKRNIIYKDLMEKGVTKKRLEQVHSPIGLKINAETPEEIAVSIVAELIKKRNPPKPKKALIL